MIPEPRFDLVVGADDSDHADAILYRAYDEALRHEHPALHIATVVGDQAASAAAGERLVERVRRTLEDAVPPERRAAWTIRLHVRTGRPEEELVALAAEAHASLIVVGRHGHRSWWRRTTSTADRIVEHAECPVLVVPPPPGASSAPEPCADCVEIRERTGGEQWFCSSHHSDRVGRLVFPPSTLAQGRGLL